MSELFNRFSLHAAKFNSQVWMCLLLIWVAVLICTMTSITAQPFSARQRKFWLLAIIGVPIFGVLAYLPFSFRREQLAQLFFVRLQKDRQKKGGTGRIHGGKAI